MKKGDKVIVRRLDDRNLPRVKTGQCGEVKAVRNLPEDKEPQALVKLQGRTWVVAFSQSQLEVVS